MIPEVDPDIEWVREAAKALAQRIIDWLDEGTEYEYQVGDLDTVARILFPFLLEARAVEAECLAVSASVQANPAIWPVADYCRARADELRRKAKELSDGKS